jgi:hypothetical protein
MKSKAMGLGNRLSSRMDRHDAFVRAWAIVKAGGLEAYKKNNAPPEPEPETESEPEAEGDDWDFPVTAAGRNTRPVRAGNFI